jgi:hypothetical protein
MPTHFGLSVALGLRLLLFSKPTDGMDRAEFIGRNREVAWVRERYGCRPDSS